MTLLFLQDPLAAAQAAAVEAADVAYQLEVAALGKSF